MCTNSGAFWGHPHPDPSPATAPCRTPATAARTTSTTALATARATGASLNGVWEGGCRVEGAERTQGVQEGVCGGCLQARRSAHGLQPHTHPHRQCATHTTASGSVDQRQGRDRGMDGNCPSPLPRPSGRDAATYAVWCSVPSSSLT